MTAPSPLSQPCVDSTEGRKLDQLPELGPVCEQEPYPRLEPGRYEGQCIFARIYRDPQFRSWKALLRFRLILSRQQVCGFFHLGQGDKPKAGTRSKYRRAWIIANGDAPRKRQVLSPRVFRGKIFEIEVCSVTRAFDGREHPPGAGYSTVREIHSRRWP